MAQELRGTESWGSGAAPGLAALLPRDPAAAVLPGLPVPADARQRHRVPPVPARRQHLRRGLGRPPLRQAVHQGPDVLGRVHQHADPRRADAAVLFPLPIVLALLLNEVRIALVQAVRPVGVLPAALPVDRDRRRHGVAADVASTARSTRSSRRSAASRSRSCSSRSGSARSTSPPRSWQTVGWGTILYLAALTTIDEHLYEAARIDGANRWRQTWHVTLPGIRPDDGDAADPQHRHVHGGRVREDPAAVQPADLPDRRRHLHVPVPGRHRLRATSATPRRSACSRPSSG